MPCDIPRTYRKVGVAAWFCLWKAEISVAPFAVSKAPENQKNIPRHPGSSNRSIFQMILHLLFLGFGKWKMHKDIRRLCLIASLDASELSALVDPWSVTYCYPASLGPWKDAIGARKRNCSTFGWFHSRASTNEVDEYLEHCDWIRSLPLKEAGKDSNFKRLRGFTSENPELYILCHSRFKQLNPSVKYDPQWRREAKMRVDVAKGNPEVHIYIIHIYISYLIYFVLCSGRLIAWVWWLYASLE